MADPAAGGPSAAAPRDWESPSPERRADPDELVRRALAREPRALARALSRIEAGGEAAAELVARVYPETGRACLVGVTGPPGAGKSTLVAALARHARAAGETVAVLAVDPTSPFTGGALLGDRVRMQDLYTDPNVFIRSMATRGALGGLAAAAHDAVDLLDAAGFDRVVVETVGVGQDEVDVVAAVDTVVVVAVPGMGDDIQANKAGVYEIGDVFALNKADRDGAERARRHLELMLHLGEPAAGGGGGSEPWSPPVVPTVATTGTGIEELAGAIAGHRRWLEADGRLAVRRRERLALRIRKLLEARLAAAAAGSAAFDQAVDEALAARTDPHRAAAHLFDRLTGGGDE